MKSLKFIQNVIAKYVLASFFVLTVFSCEDSKNDPVEAAPTKNLYELITEKATGGDKGLDSLKKYIDKSTKLVDALKSTTTSTFFAPNNAAFVGLLSFPGFPPIERIDPKLIEGVLFYHISQTKIYAKSEIVKGLKIETLYKNPSTKAFEEIEVNADGTLKTGSTTKNIPISTADIKATNGVLHIIDNVLIPLYVGAVLTPILGTVAATPILGADFTYFHQMLQKADKYATSAGYPTLSSFLMNKEIKVTLFIIPNETFEAFANINDITVDEYLAKYDGAAAYNLIYYSINYEKGIDGNSLIVGAKITVGNKTPAPFTFTLVEGASITTGGTGIFFDNNSDGKASFGDVEIIKKNVATASNGYVHLVTSYLIKH